MIGSAFLRAAVNGLLLGEEMTKRGAGKYPVLLGLCALFMTSNAEANNKRVLQLGTFNIRWFGSAEHDRTYQFPSTKSERVGAVKDFLDKEVFPLDVVSFEEIVDLKALRMVLPRGWTCATYLHPNPLHQKVAVCASGEFHLAPVPYDNDGLINELAYYDADRARPAVRVDVVEKKTGLRLVRVVAVHLKSAPHFALLRLKQVGMIARDLQHEPYVPTVVMGDFNTFSAKQTGLEKDDVHLIGYQLSQSGTPFKQVPHSSHTYRQGSLRGQFDHFYVNNLVKAVSVPQTFSVCNNKNDGPGYKNRSHYLRYVSDHCPVKMKITL